MKKPRTEEEAERRQEYYESLDWEIEETYDCVDTDTYEASCIASDDEDQYAAYCIVNRGSDGAGEIVDIDYSTVERI